MKDIYRNPILYYVLVPVVLALWPLIVGGIYLQDAQESLKEEMGYLKEARSKALEILSLVPDRLAQSDPKTGATDFMYLDAIDRAATLCGIPPTDYRPSTKPITARKGGPKSQDCHVIINEIDILRFARFLSTLQLQWARLQCVNATLTSRKGLPDKWKVDLDFKYYYSGGS